MELKDYRKISIIGIFYKIELKLLNEIQKGLIIKFVSGHQNDSRKTRQITDATLISNEILKSCLSLTLTKKNEQFNRPDLIRILGKKGLREGWTKWIKYCIITIKYSILINYGPDQFSHHRKDTGKAILTHHFSLFLQWKATMVC